MLDMFSWLHAKTSQFSFRSWTSFVLISRLSVVPILVILPYQISELDASSAWGISAFFPLLLHILPESALSPALNHSRPKGSQLRVSSRVLILLVSLCTRPRYWWPGISIEPHIWALPHRGRLWWPLLPPYFGLTNHRSVLSIILSHWWGCSHLGGWTQWWSPPRLAL